MDFTISSRPSTEWLRLLHWNIHSWLDEDDRSNVEAVVAVIRETNPDVVSLVEVDEPWGAPDRLGEVAHRTGYGMLFVPTFEFGGDNPAGGFGNALLTRLPVLAVQQWQLVRPMPYYDGSERSEPRSMVLAKLEAGGRRIWVGSTHLPRSDEPSRTAALRRLANLVTTLDEPWLVCGDFNMTPPDWLTGRDGIGVCPAPVQPTHTAGNPAEPIDYCLLGFGMRAEGTALHRSGSDHLPVLISAWRDVISE